MKTVKDIAEIIERLAPKSLAMEGDNVGLIVGYYEKEVRKNIINS